MRLFLMLIPFAALGGLASVAPKPATESMVSHTGAGTGYWRVITD